MSVSLRRESMSIPPQEFEQLPAPEAERIMESIMPEAVGHAALQTDVWTQTSGWGSEEVNEQTTRTVEVGGNQIETDLPEDVEIVLVGLHPKRPSIPIKEVDKLSAGKFTLYDQDNRSFTQGNVAITEHDDFRRINHLETTIPVYGLRPIGEGAGQLMEELGFLTDREGNWADESPTPGTLKSKTAALNVDVRFFADANLISGHDYLSTFKNGQYPVALGSGEYYAHDTSDDHLTAMVLGGEELKEALATAAGRVLELGAGPELNDAAASIDRYTATLRGIMNPKGLETGGPRTEFMPANGRKYFHRIGVGLGISPEASDHIIAAAQARAREHGIPVQELA